MVAIILTALRLPDIGSGNWAHTTILPSHSKDDNGCMIVIYIGIMHTCMLNYAYTVMLDIVLPVQYFPLLGREMVQLGTYFECRAREDIGGASCAATCP